MTDEELVLEALSGNDEALPILHDRYVDMIYQYVYVQTKNHHDTEEIVQDSFYKMATKLHSFDHKSTFKTWLYTICRNTLLDFHRKKRKDRSVSAEDVHIDGLFASRSAEEEVLQKHSPILDALKHLKKDYQDVLLLRFVQNLSLNETAEIMDKSVFAVKSLQKRASKKFVSILDERWEQYGHKR
ncbi:RNA polymerase sigma factor [Paenalkalicoccus suaedae]|uniref:RNA polymerase sigma factor n=1 Tax=Paenalkalicoccus suaedae TaxID=2592382 RepID=A0A859FJS6_9BACI|nr:RNA polymerase sigma factor [Paenalkalicoccus suaedae]QKS73049.1 RNA polymerase sigma factor [Paenalkalicoccus suaedae]